MRVNLSSQDQRMLAGKHGEAARLAMSIIARMAGVVGAEELMNVTQAHIDGCGLLSHAGLEFAETLAGAGGRVRIPTTLNMGPLDLQNWREFGVQPDFAEKAIRQATAYESMGCVPTWTCAPYQGYLTPRFGQQIAWGESNAVCYANSVLGARTNRYGDYLDICAAITGRVPRQGLHLTENRKGRILVRVSRFDVDAWRDDTAYSALGHLLGPIVGDKISVIEGLPLAATSDQLKAFSAAVASSGSVAMFHAPGITPEAQTVEEAFDGNRPERVIEIHPADLAAARRDLSTAEEGDKLDEVVLGCPHFSYDEFRQLADVLRREQAQAFHPDVTFTVISGTSSYSLVQRSRLMGVLEAYRIRVTLDTCPFHTPMIGPATRVLMTNSGKCAYYGPGELGVKIAFGTIAECVRSAIEGCVSRTDQP